MLTWASGYIAKAGAAPATVDALATGTPIDAAAIADFRSFAQTNGVSIPTDAATDSAVSSALLRNVAFARFGTSGVYRLVALTDPWVRAAIDAFSVADGMLNTRRAPKH